MRRQRKDERASKKKKKKDTKETRGIGRGGKGQQAATGFNVLGQEDPVASGTSRCVRACFSIELPPRRRRGWAPVAKWITGAALAATLDGASFTAAPSHGAMEGARTIRPEELSATSLILHSFAPGRFLRFCFPHLSSAFSLIPASRIRCLPGLSLSLAHSARGRAFIIADAGL